MKKITILLSIIILTSCGKTLQKESIIGCWKVAYLEVDGIKQVSGQYKICINENGSFEQQKMDGTEKIKYDWSLMAEDSLLILHNNKRLPDTMRIVKVEENEMCLERKIKYSSIKLFLRKEN